MLALNGLARLMSARAYLRQSYPFSAALGMVLVLIVTKGGSFTENFVFLFVLLPFVLSLTHNDAGRLVGNPVILAFAIYLLTLLASLIGKATLPEALRYVQRAAVGLAFVAFIAWHIGRSRPKAEINLGLAFGAIMACDILLSLWMRRDITGFSGILILMPWPNQNTGAAVLAFSFVLLTNAFIQTQRSPLRFLVLAMAGSVFVGILLTRSRGALIVALLSAIGATIFHRNWWWLVGGAALLGCLLASAVLLGILDIGLLWARGDSSRLLLWKGFGEVAQSHAWRGIGINREFSITIQTPEGSPIDNPHNMIIFSALYAGLLAGLAYIVFLGVNLVSGFMVGSPRDQVLALSLAMFLILYGLVESALLISRPDWLWLVFLIPIGCIAGTLFQRVKPASSE